MRRGILELAAWTLSRLAPDTEAEALVGDLLEEYALRANVDSPSGALRWYLQQVCKSGLHMMRARLTRTAWPSTVAVALIAYVAVVVIEFTIKREITTSPAATMVIAFPTVALIAYFAAKLRSGAPLVLGLLMVLVVTLMILTANESPPLWNRIAYYFVGPGAVFIGGALRSVLPRKT